VVVLGMGNDGHTASFFPGGDNLATALAGEAPVVTMRAPGAGEPRVTLSLNRLLKADGLYLHIEGEEKAKVLEQALADGPVEDMPIRAVLRQTVTPLNVYWCP
jgi:6-phosphogluconolactonase